MRSLLARTARQTALLVPQRLAAPSARLLGSSQLLPFGPVVSSPSPSFSVRCLAKSSSASSADAAADPPKRTRGRKKAAAAPAADGEPPSSAAAAAQDASNGASGTASRAAASAAAPPAPPPAAPPQPVQVTWNEPPGPAWDLPQKWVVFSDLHVNRRSLDVCLEVLREVRPRLSSEFYQHLTHAHTPHWRNATV